MKLRHKKPLNPYKGQANSGKNEINDDDFKHQPSPLKKNAVVPNEQIYKYARILTNFLKTINEDYRDSDGQAVRTRPNFLFGGLEEQKISDQFLSGEPKQGKEQQIKQQQQIPKLQSKFQSKKKIVQRHSSRKKERPVPPIITSDSTYVNPLNQEHKSLNNAISSNVSQKTSATQRQNSNSSRPQTTGNSTPKGLSNGNNASYGQGSSVGAFPNINSMNISTVPNNLFNFSANLPAAMFNFRPQDMTDFFHKNVFSNNLMPELMQGLSSSMTQPNKGKPNAYAANNLFRNNMGLTGQEMQGINLQGLNCLNQFGINNLQFQFQPQQFGNHGSTIMKPGDQFSNQTQSYVKGLSENLFNKHVQSTQKLQSMIDEKRQEQSCPFPLKRAAYHVSIAYKIYLDQLKAQGKDYRNLKNFDQIDPTRNSRKMKVNNANSNAKSREKSKDKRI